MQRLEELRELLSRPKRIVVTSHRNPDGDAIGSSIALQLFLEQYGHEVTVVYPSEYPDFVKWMPHIEQTLITDNSKNEVSEAIAAAEVLFALDYNDLRRVDETGQFIAKSKVPKVLIDHHLHPENFADFVMSDTTASSTCELVYRFVDMLGATDRITQPLAECLYTGILTDTGSFKYATSPRLFRVVAALLEHGVDDYRIQMLIFDTMTEKQLSLLGHCLANRMEILEEYATGIIYLTRQDYERFNIQRGDTEGIVNYLLKLEKVRFAAFITEQPKIIKLSLRSKGDFSVQELASKYFNGGGHKNASGGHVYGNIDRTVQRLKDLLPQYQEQLRTKWV